MRNLIYVFGNKVTYFIGLMLSCLSIYYSNHVIAKWHLKSINGLKECFHLLGMEGFGGEFALGLFTNIGSTICLFILVAASLVAFQEFHDAIRVTLSIICLVFAIYQLLQLITFFTTSIFVLILAAAVFFVATSIFDNSRY